MLLACGAFALMLVTLFLGVKFLTHQQVAVLPEEPPPAVEMVPVVVAKANIPARTRIQEGMLQMKSLPVDMVPEGAIKNFSEVKDVQVKVSIFAGDVLTIQKVFAESSDEGFVGAIPPDCRAVSISVNDLTGVAGFARPGDHVDLLLVEKGANSVTTNILLQNVPLLSINQDTGSSPLGENGAPAAISSPSIATFALHPDDMLKLISASKLGEIYMALRPSKPQRAYVDAMEYTIESVNAPQPAREAPPTPVIPANAPLPQIPSAPPQPVTPKIEIIQGDQVVQAATAPPSGGPVNPPTNLPVIPSNGVNPAFSAPPAPPVPHAPIVNPPANN